MSTIKHGRHETFSLDVGEVLKVDGTAGSATVWHYAPPSRDPVSSTAVDVGDVAPIGPFTVAMSLDVVCTLGEVTASVSRDAAVSPGALLTATVALTQTEYDALPFVSPTTLYVILEDA